MDILIAGAGISGLIAANKLKDLGYTVTVVDKGRGVGGRMATRRIANGRADHGAQFFTVRHDAFSHYVENWLVRGLIRPWSMGWSDGSIAAPSQDGHPRYVGDQGMTTVPKHLAAGLNVRLNTELTRVTANGSGWLAEAEDGSRFRSRAILLTPPVPQSLALLHAGGVRLSPADHDGLAHISYDPCLAGLFLIEGNVDLPEPGAIQRPEHTFPWIADNRRKGISPVARLITVHTAPALARDLWDADDGVKIAVIEQALSPFLDTGAAIAAAQAHRWRYAIPTTLHAGRTLLAAGLPPLAFAGDAFGEPRVEGAALSGLAAAETLAAALSS